MNDTRIRTFFAVSPGESSLATLAAASEPLRALTWAERVRWTPLVHLHITLKYLGSTPAGLVPALARAVENAELPSPFTWRTEELAFFPSRRKPKVVAARLSDSPELAALAASLDQVCVEFGFEAERRPFRPHLTLGRIKGRLSGNVDMPAAGAVIEDRVTAFRLFRSDTLPAGAVYRELARFAL